MEHSPQNGSGLLSRSSLQASTGRIAAIATAFLLVMFLVLSVSRAALVAETNNRNNTASTTGTITLTDDDFGTALFSIANAGPTGVDPITSLPTNTFVNCIRVEYTNTGAFNSSLVQLYAENIPAVVAPETEDLADYLNIKVETVDTSAVPLSAVEIVAPLRCNTFDTAAGAVDEFYNGPLSGFPSSFDTTAVGLAVPGITDYKITVTVADDYAAANLTTGWDFVWETHS